MIPLALSLTSSLMGESKMRSYRIVLEYTTANDEMTSPDTWDWHDLVAPNVDETISPVRVEEIETPEGHLEEITNG